MYAIEKLVTKFEQPNVWVRQNKYQYDKKEAKVELSSLRRTYRDIKFRIVKIT